MTAEDRLKNVRTEDVRSVLASALEDVAQS